MSSYDYWSGFMFRFITGDENLGLRWTSGDEIDMFTLDFENSEYADNAGFVLESATELLVSGVILFVSAVLV